MVKQTDVNASLDAFRNTDTNLLGQKALEARVTPPLKKLPTALRTIGFAIYGMNEKGVSLPSRWNLDEEVTKSHVTSLERNYKQFEALSVAERMKILAPVGREIADWLEAAWQFLKSAPYKFGYNRCPFRAPTNPEVTLMSRASWLHGFALNTAHFKSEVLTPQWLATWAKHAFDYNADNVTPILITAMNSKLPVGNEVYEILYQTVTREHPTAVMADFVIQSLLGASRQSGWELIEKTLLAAQRQEGLRQSILDGSDMAHPEAFKRLLRLIIDEDLIRFSSVARSVDVWLRLLWDSSSTRVLHENVESILSLLDSPAAHKEALKSDDPETVYRALWVSAIDNAPATVKLAQACLKNSNDEIRYVAVWLLTQLGLDAARVAKSAAIEDPNLQIATLASINLNGLTSASDGDVINRLTDHRTSLSREKGYFDRLESLYHRLPEKTQTLPAIVWPWTERKIQRSDLCNALLENLGDLPPTRILPYLKGLHSWHQQRVIQILAEQKKWDQLTRSAMIELAGHTSVDVRKAAFVALEKQKLNDDELAILESYLSRTTADLRVGAVAQLMRQTDSKAFESARRLIESKHAKMRLAGLELLRQLAEADRGRAECVRSAASYRDSRKKLSQEEEIQLQGISDSNKANWSLKNALGLMDSKGISKVAQPKMKKVTLITKAAIDCMKSLDDLIHKNRDVPVRYKKWNEWTNCLFGEIEYGLPNIDVKKPLEKQFERFPLWDTWAQWRDQRPSSMRDKDGLELLRSLVACSALNRHEYSGIAEHVQKPDEKKFEIAVLGSIDPPKLKYPDLVQSIMDWLFYSELPKGVPDYLLDCVENSMAQVTPKLQDLLLNPPNEKSPRNYWGKDLHDWRNYRAFEAWRDMLNSFCQRSGIKLTREQIQRRYELECYRDRPIEGAKRKRIDFSELALAYQNKWATYNDLVDALIGPDREQYDNYDTLHRFTQRTLSPDNRKVYEATKGLPELVNQVRDLLLEIELARGEKQSVSTEAVLKVSSFNGVDHLFRILRALNGKFKKVSGWSAKVADSREATLTELATATCPMETETVEDFDKQVKMAMAEGALTEDLLLELAFLAPQWSKWIGEILKWDGFSEGVYWFLAHMNSWMSDATSAAASAEGIIDDVEKTDDIDDTDEDESNDTTSVVKPKKLSAWERLILERTPLTAAERDEGAVDVSWFHRTFAALGEKRWQRMASGARFAANASQARKAQFVADVLLGKVNRTELVDGIKKRNLKEYVRLLGLLPLAKGGKRDKDISERYQVLLDYKKYARRLSSLTKPQAIRAVEIGLSNLARLAGYADPLRLEWALEAESIKDLAKGPISITKEGVSVTLQLNEDAKPELIVQRSDKRLKSVPGPIKQKHAAVAELVDRATDLRRKASRVKQSLESAMCRADLIDAGELHTLMNHAILAPQLKRLVLIGDGIAGYPDKNGKVLRDYSGKFEPIKSSEKLRIAHSADLLKMGDWHKWQSECFQVERVQPFKQVFRELYVPTKQEAKAVSSTRFAGHQIGPKQAMALWGNRGWSTHECVQKILHDRSMIANISFQDSVGTAAEVEGLTVDKVTFVDRDSYKELKLTEVPAEVFSEVMRDIDLVVSVAHRGEVDPEASESTIEMRSTIVRETCQLLGIKNVKFKPNHVVIDGHYGEYSLHLGSGGIQKLPGGAIAIVAVGAQHRGRLFLPFADDDPKTAEIVSKALLLARDEEILDPTILDQLGAPIKRRPSMAIGAAASARSKPTTKGSSKPGSDSKSSNEKSLASNRRFEFSEGISNKFWEISILGDTVTSTWGRIGTEGQSKCKQFASAEKARQYFEKLIAAKTGKGYYEA